MKKSTITTEFSSDIQSVWNIVSDNENYKWRSDLSKIEVSRDGNSFTEYTKDGFKTEFMITLKKPCQRYEFSIKNKNMSGRWIGIFSSQGTGTQIEFTEEVAPENPVMNLFIGGYLKKQQNRYVRDLRKALGE